MEITEERKIELFKLQDIWDDIYIPHPVESPKMNHLSPPHVVLPKRNKIRGVHKKKRMIRFSKKSVKDRERLKELYWSNQAYRVRNKSILPQYLPRRSKCTL